MIYILNMENAIKMTAKGLGEIMFENNYKQMRFTKKDIVR